MSEKYDNFCLVTTETSSSSKITSYLLTNSQRTFSLFTVQFNLPFKWIIRFSGTILAERTLLLFHYIHINVFRRRAVFGLVSGHSFRLAHYEFCVCLNCLFSLSIKICLKNNIKATNITRQVQMIFRHFIWRVWGGRLSKTSKVMIIIK